MDPTVEAAPRRRRGIYLLPNLFTTVTLFGGFFAIVSAMRGDWADAAKGILAAMVADTFDGLIARLTKTSSDFGKEYDSLCDMVAFGIAASIVVYAFSLQYLADYKWLGGKLGWVAAFAYTACAALRLARFNVLATRGGAKGDFFGLPSPAAAAVVVGFVWAMDYSGLNGRELVILAIVLTLGAAALMVSSIRFVSLKQIKLTERVPFRYIVIAIGIFVLFWINPPWIFFLVFLGYALSGPLMAVYRRMQRPPAAPAAAGREPPSV